MPHPKRERVPKLVTHQQTHPPELATFHALDAEGLKPGEARPVALLRVVRPGFESLSGLYRRDQAVPKEPAP